MTKWHLRYIIQGMMSTQFDPENVHTMLCKEIKRLQSKRMCLWATQGMCLTTWSLNNHSHSCSVASGQIKQRCHCSLSFHILSNIPSNSTAIHCHIPFCLTSIQVGWHNNIIRKPLDIQHCSLILSVYVIWTCHSIVTHSTFSLLQWAYMYIGCYLWPLNRC